MVTTPLSFRGLVGFWMFFSVFSLLRPILWYFQGDFGHFFLVSPIYIQFCGIFGMILDVSLCFLLFTSISMAFQEVFWMFFAVFFLYIHFHISGKVRYLYTQRKFLNQTLLTQALSNQTLLTQHSQTISWLKSFYNF